MATAQAPKRSEIWLVNFDPAAGAEIRKARPAVVVSIDSIGRLPLRIVVPVTDWKPVYAGYPWFAPIAASRTSGLRKDSGADAFQVKSVAESRFQHRIGRVTTGELDAIVEAIALCVGVP